ncbi:MAG: AAA family ATPase [Treponemataceae bacterium]|nr:MAG: AAA family ATPase [Treponemataceae bacterium]
MAQHDLFDKSPIRLINKITNGTLKRGDAALIASKKGLGKTSVLVQFGVDDLFQDKQVVHVSFNQKAENVITWYEDVFTEIAKKKPSQTHSLSELVKKRIILNFNQDIIALPSVIATVKALAASGIKSECLLIDDLDFSKITAADLQAVRDYAKAEGIFVCVSTASEGETGTAVVPPEFEAVFDTIFRLAPRPDMIELQCLKNTGGISPIKLRLDSKTLLITEK